MEIGTDRVTIWTLQPLKVWELLKENGQITVDKLKSANFADWPDSYEWMRSQMQTRLSEYHGLYPWWGWLQPKPDLRYWRHNLGFSNGEHVRLELVMPAKNLLISDRASWDVVIMRGYIAYTSLELKNWEELLIASGIDETNWPLEQPWRGMVEKSWERIFDIEGLRKGNLWNTARIQAVFEVLDIKNVVSVAKFRLSG